MSATRLARIRELDPDRALFGAESHKHHLLPPLSERELFAIETELGVELPEAYRRYVQEVSSGGMGPGYGLPWLSALLLDHEASDRSYCDAASAGMFPEGEHREWAATEFAPLGDAEIDARLQFVPPALRDRMRSEATWVRTFEARRNRYIEHCCSAHRTVRMGRASHPFPFAARHSAAPDIDAIDWASLDEDERVRAFDGLRLKFGFDQAENGTIRLGDYGCGAAALLVIRGDQRGTVWMFDSENLVLEPFFPRWADCHRHPSPRPPWDFDAWFGHWIDGAESQLAKGIRPSGRLVWG